MNSDEHIWNLMGGADEGVSSSFRGRGGASDTRSGTIQSSATERQPQKENETRCIK